MAYKITPKGYNSYEPDYVPREPISIHELALGAGIEEMASLLSEWCNKGAKDFSVGKKVGEQLRGDHRTLQGLVGRLALGILVGLGEQEYTDARNEKIVAVGKELKRQIENGELDMGYMI